MLAALLAVTLAAADAPVWDVHQASECLLIDQNKVGKGCWLSDDSCLGVGKDLGRLRAENKSLKASVESAAPRWVWIAVAAVAGVGAGVGVGWLVWSRPPATQ